MTNRRSLNLRAQLALIAAPAVLSAQTTAGVIGVPDAPAHSDLPLRHDKKLVATYDSVADSTHLAVVTHKGKYFLWTQHPRLTWSVTYAGRAPSAQAPAEVVLEFRTQNPQVAVGSRLVLELTGREPMEVASVGAYSDPGAMTWSHFMRFPIPTAELARALVNEEMRLSVGGIRVHFKRDQMTALRDLLSRVGAWPAALDSGGA
jgi:hypothetical protein